MRVLKNLPTEQRSKKAYCPVEIIEFSNSQHILYKKICVIVHPKPREFYSITGDMKIKFSGAAALRMSLVGLL